MKSKLQIESMDEDLRNGLWNCVSKYYWSMGQGRFLSDASNHYLALLVADMWQNYFKKPLDVLDTDWKVVYGDFRRLFFQWKWNEVYDFIEFLMNSQWGINTEHFIPEANSVLERELAGYRIMGTTIVEITAPEEIAAIDHALEAAHPFKNVRTHLQQAVEHYASRKQPDYRNSIKESISAVEALCCTITDNPKASLGEALNDMERRGRIKLHPALKGALTKLYGYTSDSDGIRHALVDEVVLEAEDAKLMLASCSAFVSYLIAKEARTR